MVGLHVSCSGTSLQVPVSTLLGDVVASAKANHPHAVQLHLRVPDVKVLDPDKAIGTAAYVTFGRKAALEAWHATQTCPASSWWPSRAPTTAASGAFLSLSRESGDKASYVRAQPRGVTLTRAQQW